MIPAYPNLTAFTFPVAITDTDTPWSIYVNVIGTVSAVATCPTLAFRLIWS